MKSYNIEDADVYSMAKDRNGEDGCNEDFDDACDVGSADTISDEDALDYGNVIGLSDQQIMRKMSNAAMAHIDGMHGYGVPTSKILGYMAGIARGYSLLGFMKKDAYNYIDKMRRSKIADGDSNAAIKNVTSNGSEQMFREIFSKWLYADMEVDEFEFQWDQAADEYGLHQKCWATQMYEKRHMWASAYLRGKFCAGYRTPSRCEGINSHVKKFLTSRHSIVDLVQNLELVVCEYCNNELVAQFTSMYSASVLTTCLDPIEKYAAAVYTRAIFMQVKRKIDGVGGLNFVSKKRVSSTMVCTIEEYGYSKLFDSEAMEERYQGY
ncbi:hypothetical protein Ahy_A03g012822 [Arachis hypogaea]|uniref:Uncharacterized protein n=1 Tax=Arachis hypogaea TaxID=3818 RepID=A0A445DUA4_ARAHY|nr:hypothetical protein Ahy_A03g012822 [Arachis hypogaea]